MYEDHRFSKLVKYLFFISIAFALTYFYYFRSRKLASNSPYLYDSDILGFIINNLVPLLSIALTWFIIQFITKDRFLSGIGFLLELVIWNYTISQHDPTNLSTDLTILFNIILFSIPHILFGILHFKHIKGISLIAFPLLSWGLQITNYPTQIENILSHPYISNILIYYNYKPSFIYQASAPLIMFGLFFIVASHTIIQAIVYHWLYNTIKSNSNPLASIKKVQLIANDRFSYSIIFWTANIYLFLIGFYIVAAANSEPLISNLYSTVLIMSSCCGMFILACLYRNFLVSRFIYLNLYPSDLYFFLNIPFCNILAWVYSLFTLFETHDEYAPIVVKEFIPQDDLKNKFILERKNFFWKNVTIIGVLLFTIMSFLRYRHQIRPLAVDISWFFPHLFTTICIICFLYFKKVFYPFSFLLVLYITLHGALDFPGHLKFNAPTVFIYITVFYGLFHFDDLHWYVNENSIKS